MTFGMLERIKSELEDARYRERYDIENAWLKYDEELERILGEELALQIQDPEEGPPRVEQLRASKKAPREAWEERINHLVQITTNTPVYMGENGTEMSHRVPILTNERSSIVYGYRDVSGGVTAEQLRECAGHAFRYFAGIGMHYAKIYSLDELINEIDGIEMR